MSLLVVEVTATSSRQTSIAVPLAGSAGMKPGGADIAWGPVSHRQVGGQAVLVWSGTTHEAEVDNTTWHPGVHQGTVQVAVVIPAKTSSVTVPNATSVLLLAAIRTGLESDDPVADALADWQAGMAVTPTALYAEHAAAWDILWESGFEVKGRPDVAAVVNSSLYYLLSSVREDRTNSLSPGGLASNGYNGHSFWDCETWMYPSILYD